MCWSNRHCGKSTSVPLLALFGVEASSERCSLEFEPIDQKSVIEIHSTALATNQTIQIVKIVSHAPY